MKRHFLVLFAIAVFVTALTTTASGQTSPVKVNGFYIARERSKARGSIREI